MAQDEVPLDPAIEAAVAEFNAVIDALPEHERAEMRAFGIEYLQARWDGDGQGAV